MKPVKVEFLPQRHEEPDAKASQVDGEVLKSQIKIARHLLKNRDAFVFVEGNMTNLPEVLSPEYYRRCNTRRYDRNRCMHPSLWRSIRRARLYFRKFDVRKDLMGDGSGPLLRDRVFRSSIVSMGAPALLYFMGAIRYVLFSDGGTHVDGVSRELKSLERLFGSLSGCFMAVPKSRLYHLMFPARERHVLKVIDRFVSKFPQKKHILVFGGLHTFTKYNGTRFQFVIPKEFASDIVYAKRTGKELASTCSYMVAHSIGLGILEFVTWIKKMLKGFFPGTFLPSYKP